MYVNLEMAKQWGFTANEIQYREASVFAAALLPYFPLEVILKEMHPFRYGRPGPATKGVCVDIKRRRRLPNGEIIADGPIIMVAFTLGQDDDFYHWAAMPKRDKPFEEVYMLLRSTNRGMAYINMLNPNTPAISFGQALTALQSTVRVSGNLPLRPDW